MDKHAHSPTHNTTSTTFKADAGTKKYHCGFFCQRTTNSDVIDPSKSSKKEDDKSTTLDTKNN